MSHVAQYECGLNKVDQETFQEAVKTLAATCGPIVTAGAQTNRHREFARARGLTYVCSVMVPGSGEGIGIAVNQNGAPVILSDTWYSGQREAYELVKKTLQTTYIGLAGKKALERMKFKTRAKTSRKPMRNSNRQALAVAVEGTKR